MQVALAVFVLITFAIWPPANGRMLLVPLTGRDANGVAAIALAGDALLLGPGPVAGSMIVVGDRSRIARHASWQGVVVLAAPRAGCGARDRA